jgi:hypothetical protein
VIYSKFGSLLTLVSKTVQASGRIAVQATAEGSADVREYLPAELKADAGSAEIERIIAELPCKVAPRNPRMGRTIEPQPLPSRQEPRFRPKSNRRTPHDQRSKR